MKYILRKHAFLFFLVLFGLGGCIPALEFKKDTDEADQEMMTCNVNGEPFEAVNDQGVFAVDYVRVNLVEDENSFLLTVYAVELLDGGAALAVGFKLGGEHLEDIKAGDTFTEWMEMENGEGDYEGAMGGVEKRASVTTDEHIFKASSNYTGKMSLTITDFDIIERKVSGTFHFSALDKENGTALEVTDGKFQNILWKEE